MFLDKSTKSFELLLGEVKTTSEVEIIAYYDDTIIERNPAIAAELVSNGTTAVTIVPAPKDNTKRTVREITIFNADTVQHAVTVRMKDGANYYRAFKYTLLPGATYQYTEDRGWFDPSVASFYAPLNSPAFVGTPTAPTAARGTSTTQLATTAFVNNPYGVFTGYLAANQTLTSATYTKLSLTKVLDSEVAWDAANFRYVIPKAGRWRIGGNTEGNAGTSVSLIAAVLSKNGVAFGSGTALLYGQTAGISSPSSVSASMSPTIVTLALNDTIELDGYMTGTGTLNMAGNTYYTTYMTIEWVGV